MKKGKVVIIYLLVLVLIGLVSYLIYFINDFKEKETEPILQQPVVTNNEIEDKCTFDITLEQYETLSSNPSSLALCQGKNKLNISNITLNSVPINMYSIYYNGILTEEDETLGLYLNENQITSTNKNTINILNNLLFVKSTKKTTNILGFNSIGDNIYNLENSLIQTEVEDPVLTELAKTNQTINTKVSLENIDPNSFSFNQTEFTFNTTTNQCTEGQKYKGSTYKVTFNGENLTNPTFVTNVSC